MGFQPMPLTWENSHADKQEKMPFTGAAIINYTTHTDVVVNNAK